MIQDCNGRVFSERPGHRMSDDIHIRSARWGDAEAIASFNVQLALETEHLRLDPAVVRAGVEAVLKDADKGVYFVAEAQGRIVGQCSITCEWSDWRNGVFWWLQSVYVEPAWRRRGAFKALYNHVLGAAEMAGVVGLRLYVDQENVPAQAVYQRQGLNPTRYLVFERPLKRRTPAAVTAT
jgi:GNAT superfamily N-acetyltransferase